jgi:opacity protein-like surface antigen
MTKFLFFAVAAFGLLGASQAEAKMTPKTVIMRATASVAPTPWTGPYFGADLEFMMGSTSVNDSGLVTETGAATNGALARLIGGYNWQVNDLWVAGIEGSVALGNVHGNGASSSSSSSPNSYDLNWAADLSARIGYVVTPDTLVFGAVGP